MNQSGKLDMDDPFEAHAFFALAFDCEECGRELDGPRQGDPYSDSWFRELARLAREEKWYVPPPQTDGSMDVMRSWCPECAARLMLTQNMRLSARTTPISKFFLPVLFVLVASGVFFAQGSRADFGWIGIAT